MTLTELSEDIPDLLVMDGHDNAIVGWCAADGTERLVYDSAVIRQNLVLQGMSWEEAHEHYQFNISCAYLGPRTPLLLNRLKEEKQRIPEFLNQR